MLIKLGESKESCEQNHQSTTQWESETREKILKLQKQDLDFCPGATKRGCKSVIRDLLDQFPENVDEIANKFSKELSSPDASNSVSILEWLGEVLKEREVAQEIHDFCDRRSACLQIA